MKKAILGKKLGMTQIFDEKGRAIPVTVVDYKPKRSKRMEFVICDPVWQWIEEARPDEIQKWIERNIEKLNQLFIDFANNNGYLTK